MFFTHEKRKEGGRNSPEEDMETYKNSLRMKKSVETAGDFLYEIASRRPENMDKLFAMDFTGNIQFMREAGITDISIGSGDKIQAIQKAEVILARLQNDDYPRDIKILDAIADAFMESTNRMKRETIAYYRSYEENMSQLPTDVYLQRLKDKGSVPIGKIIRDSRPGNDTRSDGILRYEGSIENFFNLKTGMWNEKTIKKAIAKARKKLNRYIWTENGGEDKSIPIEKAIVERITAYNGIVDDKNDFLSFRIFELYRFADYKHVDEDQGMPFLLYTGMAKWRTCFKNGWQNKEKLYPIASEAIDRVIRAYILYFIVDYMDKNISETKKLTVEERFEKGPEVHDCKDLQFLFKKVSDIDYNEMIMLCYFAVTLELNKKQMIEDKADLFELTEASGTAESVKERNSIEAENRRLRDELEKKTRELEEEKEKNRRADKDEWDKKSYEARIDSLTKANIEAERDLRCEIKNKEKEIEDKNEEIEALSQQVDFLTGMMEELKEKPALNENEAAGLRADTSRRYFFVCENEIICRNILSAFPNSKCSFEHALTADNAGLFDLAVFLPGKLPHNLYWGTKALSKRANLPLLHCNTTGINSIKRFLAENGYCMPEQECPAETE